MVGRREGGIPGATCRPGIGHGPPGECREGAMGVEGQEASAQLQLGLRKTMHQEVEIPHKPGEEVLLAGDAGGQTVERRPGEPPAGG